MNYTDTFNRLHISIECLHLINGISKLANSLQMEKEAQEIMVKLLAIFSKDPITVNLLDSFNALKTGKLEEAKAFLKIVENADPNNLLLKNLIHELETNERRLSVHENDRFSSHSTISSEALEETNNPKSNAYDNNLRTEKINDPPLSLEKMLSDKFKLL